MTTTTTEAAASDEIMEPRLWKRNGWTCRVRKNEDDDGWAVEMIRDANALLDDAGVSLDSDPRRVAKSGSAQDAAQMAAVEIAATGAAMPVQHGQSAR